MKNVFLLGNGFDLHHKLPTKYFDFICVAKYLTTKTLSDPINIGKVFLQCKESKNITECYEAHKEVYDGINVDFQKAVEITELLHDNIWFNYFLKTLNMDLGWIDFEKEISTVIEHLDKIISEEDETVYLSPKEVVSSFVLNNFKYFLDIDEGYDVCEGETHSVKDEYLQEYIYNSGIFVANKKKIFEELYKQLLNFGKALNIYLCYFVENAFDLLHKDAYTKKTRIGLLNKADSCVSFNYTYTLERLYSHKKAYHIHGTVKNDDIVLGVNPNKSDDSGTDNTSLIKFKKYYQREVRGTDRDYIEWYRETIGAKREYRVIIIGHSLDETDKDILSDMLLNAKEIYVTYYNEECRDDYIKNIVKIFGKNGFDSFRREKNMMFIPLSNIDDLTDKMKSDEIDWKFSWGSGEKIEPI